MKTEIQQKLEQLAFNRTIPFCYGCYIKAPKGVCPECHSDDLMRHLDGVGCEWGTDWVISHILEEELKAVDTEEAFEDSIRSCYPEETQIGWIKMDTVTVIKEIDPTSWELAKSEWESQEVEDGGLVTFDNGSTFYWLLDVESLIK
ncbi:MAG TPA: hypothetical protein VNJ08_03765 [Bacteriovoracaceae bacterium]|nr:hypothetical protein [Bacteriovoracaceae bacterium]